MWFAIPMALCPYHRRKLIKSELKTKTSRTKKQQITTRLHHLDKQYPSSIIPYKHTNMKTINKHIKTLTQIFKKIKRTQYHYETHF